MNESIHSLSAMLTPLIAILTFYIVYQQYQIQKYRAKFDLFERRMLIYSSIRETIIVILKDGDIKDSNQRDDFYNAVRLAKFLFSDNNLLNHIKEIEINIKDFEINNIKLYGTSSMEVSDERNKVSNIVNQILNKLPIQLESFDNAISDFMKINKI